MKDGKKKTIPHLGRQAYKGKILLIKWAYFTAMK